MDSPTQQQRTQPTPINTQLPSSSSADDTSTPPLSASSSPPLPSTSTITKKRSRSPLSLDLTTLPPLSSPSPPSNTLLITRLSDPLIFHPASLATIRSHLSSIAPLNSFSPLKSMARIIVSFFDEQSAIAVRQAIDGTSFGGSKDNISVAKCYFGEHTPIAQETKYLERPDAGRLFFISPPPSPPVGWEGGLEGEPNKEVHAEDLASKLSRLTGRMGVDSANAGSSPVEEERQYTGEELSKLKHGHERSEDMMMGTPRSPASGGSPKKMRSRSSTLIYDPKAHGDSPGLPAVMLQTEDDDDSEVELEEQQPPRKIMAHTPRPPVELMER